MRYERNVRAALCAALLASGSSCSADPSLLTDGRGTDPRKTQSSTDPALPGASAPAGAPPTGEGPQTGPPTGEGARDGGGAADGGARPNAFTGAPAFVATLGPSARRDAHDFADNTPPTNPAKQACLGCHVAGGAAPAFAFAGTAFVDVTGTIPAAGVEIRVRAPDGVATSVYTDEDGNFYASAAGTFPADVGVRDAASIRVMSGAAPDGNCSAAACHGGAHPWIHLP